MKGIGEMIRKARYSVILICFLGLLIISSFVVNTGPAAETRKVRPDVQRLEGRWIRPDGGYVLELHEIKADGTLKAAYFNPRPINVHEATYRIRQGKISLFVELWDINYPGSKYHLRYDSKTDCLKGNYFQAIERQNYEVEFMRVR